MCLKFRLPGSVNCGYELFRMRECTCARHTVVNSLWVQYESTVNTFTFGQLMKYYVLFTIFEKIRKKEHIKFEYKQ